MADFVFDELEMIVYIHAIDTGSPISTAEWGRDRDRERERVVMGWDGMGHQTIIAHRHHQSWPSSSYRR